MTKQGKSSLKAGRGRGKIISWCIVDPDIIKDINLVDRRWGRTQCKSSHKTGQAKVVID